MIRAVFIFFAGFATLGSSTSATVASSTDLSQFFDLGNGSYAVGANLNDGDLVPPHIVVAAAQPED